MATWRCLDCDEHGTGTVATVQRLATQHMNRTQHTTIAQAADVPDYDRRRKP